LHGIAEAPLRLYSAPLDLRLYGFSPGSSGSVLRAAAVRRLQIPGQSAGGALVQSPETIALLLGMAQQRRSAPGAAERGVDSFRAQGDGINSVPTFFGSLVHWVVVTPP